MDFWNKVYQHYYGCAVYTQRKSRKMMGQVWSSCCCDTLFIISLERKSQQDLLFNYSHKTFSLSCPLPHERNQNNTFGVEISSQPLTVKKGRGWKVIKNPSLSQMEKGGNISLENTERATSSFLSLHSWISITQRGCGQRKLWAVFLSQTRNRVVRVLLELCILGQ